MAPNIYRQINLSHGSQCPKYLSRLAWQAIFDYGREHNLINLSKMDSLLCDLYTLERLFTEGQPFIASWDGSNTGWTEMWALNYDMPNSSVNIQWFTIQQKIIIRVRTAKHGT